MASSINIADHKTLTWQNISAHVPLQGKKMKGEKSTKQVLENVNGVALAGEVLAIMGGSGAGKTTLMNTLALQESSSVTVKGKVLVNGQPITEPQAMQRISAYVQQHDMFCGSIKVKEQLYFSAQLRLPASWTQEQREQRVQEVARDMNLLDCMNTVIGVPGRVKGISIGEKKRLAFACEVLTDPSILFCDEPTSGLDSFMASQVVSALRDMAARGKTIVCVIHQPSSQVFEMFDKVCFMARGQPAYHGPVSELAGFFGGLGREDLAVPESYNPADHAITKLSVIPETKEEDAERVEFIREAFKQHKLGEIIEQQAMQPAMERSSASSGKAKQSESSGKYAVPFSRQFAVLMRRSFLTTLRDPVVLQVRLIQIILTCLAVSAVSWRMEITGPTTRNFEGVLYNVARDMNFLFLFPSVHFICAELPLFFRENKAHIYSVEAYYLAKTTAELPQYTVLPLIYGIIVYWATGMNPTAPQFLIFLCICILQVYVATSIAYAGACLFGEIGMCVTWMNIYVLPMLVFGGFYIKFSMIPVYFRWLSYLSWFRYGFEALQINQWETIPAIAGCPANGTLPSTCEAYDGPGLLIRRSMEPKDFWMDVGILFAFFFAYRAIGYLALFVRAKYLKAD